MGARYLTDLAGWLRAAGVTVVEQDGWQTRARSSGGFDSGRPCCVMWHHTASTTSPEADAQYMSYGSADRPLANVLLARDGSAWVLAAGATNTNGKGGPVTVPPGVSVPADSMNTYGVGVEIANNGVGEAYPVAQVDAALAVSAAICRGLGLPVDAVCTHAAWTLYTRKIDPATAAAVQGPWRPASATSSGTWSLEDLRAELRHRASSPPPPEEDDVQRFIRHGDNAWVVGPSGKFWVSTNEAWSRLAARYGDPEVVDRVEMECTGPVLGVDGDPLNPTTDPYGRV